MVLGLTREASVAKLTDALQVPMDRLKALLQGIGTAEPVSSKESLSVLEATPNFRCVQK